MASAVSTVSTKLIGIPRGSCHFQAPSTHPTDRTTDTSATMITVNGNHPVMMLKLMAKVPMVRLPKIQRHPRENGLHLAVAGPGSIAAGAEAVGLNRR